jgi:hypothetical protein
MKISEALIGLIAVLSMVFSIVAVNQDAQTIVSNLGGVTNYDSLTLSEDLIVGDDATITGDAAITGDVSVTGSIAGDDKVSSIAATNQYSTTTLTAANSGTTYYVSASGTTITLPAVTSSGASFRFVISGAVDTGNVIVTSAEGDNIEGALIVAGAVVDCDATDVVTFVADGENLGDYVEVRSNGSKWFIGDSGALTASKLTCSG